MTHAWQNSLLDWNGKKDDNEDEAIVEMKFPE